MSGKRTPVTNLADAISGAIERRLGDVHTCIPGNIAAYDAATQTADVEIAIKRKLANGTAVTVPIIRKVPVCFPRTSKHSITFPLEKGDKVLVLFSERALDNWKKAGTRVSEPADVPRFFDYSDAVVIPGIYPTSDAVAFDDATERDGITIKTDGVKFTLTSDGKIKAGKVGSTQTEPMVLGNVLKSALTDLIAEIKGYSADLVTGPVGIGNAGAPVPVHPTLAAAWAIRDANLDTLANTYITQASSNIVSQIHFIERGD